MILPGSYANGFAPRDGQPLYPELWRGCVGAWNPGLGPTGLTLRDWSGFGNHGTLTNMVPGEDWVASQGRYALDFDGVNDWVSFSVPSLGSSAITLVARARQSTNRADDHIVKMGTATLDNAFGIYKGFGATTSHIFAGLHANLASEVSVAVTATEWTHYAATLTVSAVSLFVNGAFAATRTGSFSYSIGTTFGSIGAAQSVLVPWGGQIADVSIYNRALSAFEIRLLASRRGIAYEMAPRRRSSFAVQFNRRRRLLLGST